MTEAITTKEQAVNRLKDYCYSIRNGKITANVYRGIKEIKDLISEHADKRAVFIECTPREAQNAPARVIRREAEKGGMLALVFIGRDISAYGVSKIKSLFEGCVRPPVIFPEVRPDDKISVYLCRLL